MSTSRAAATGAAALLAAALLGGCGSATGSDDRDDGAGDKIAAVDGRTFLSTRVTSDGRPRQLVPGSRIELSFDNGSFSARAGCNAMSGELRVDGDRLVSTGVVAMTEMACDEPLMQQEAWVAKALGPAELTLDGDVLTVAAEDGTVIELVDQAVADPDRPLTETTWHLEAIIAGPGQDGVVASVPAGVTSTLQISDDGKLALRAGCNSGGGNVDVGDGVLRLGPVATTRMACDGERMRVERAVLAVVSQGEIAYSIDVNTLTLTTGNHGLVYRAR